MRHLGSGNFSVVCPPMLLSIHIVLATVLLRGKKKMFTISETSFWDSAKCSIGIDMVLSSIFPRINILADKRIDHG